MIHLKKFLKPYALAAVLCILLVAGQAVCELKLPSLMSDIVNIGIQSYGIESAIPTQVSDQTLAALAAYMPESEAKLALSAYQGGALTELGEETRAVLEPAFQRAFFLLATGVPPAMADKVPEVGETVMQQAAVQGVRAEYQALGLDTDKIQRDAIWRTGGKMLGLTVVILACTVLCGFLAGRVAAGFGRDLRHAVYEKTLSFGQSEFGSFSTASLITRTTNDVQQMQMICFMGLRMLAFAPIMGIGGVIYAVRTSVSMSWIIALAVVVLLGIIAVIFSINTPRFKIMQKLVDRLNQVSRENLSGIMVSRAYNTQEFEKQRFEGVNTELSGVTRFVNRINALMQPFMMFIMNGMSLLIIWVGAGLISSSSLQIGDMMAYIQYSMHVVMSFLMVSMMFIMLPRAAVSGDRVWKVLQTENTIHDPQTPVSPDSMPQKRGEVEFRNVSFRFSDAEADTLHDISFVARPGETTAIIGATGSGKSTVLNLIPRFLDASEGQVLVNGVDVRDMTQHELRGQLGYVPQKAVLFSGTIAENLALGGRTLTGEEMREASRIAQAEEFVTEKPQGFAEQIAQGGSNVSGGQRQRLAIARALTLRAPIYLFDDSFSALDFKTDAALRRSLQENAADSTKIIVAQRVGTIRNAEQIVVLEDGAVAGIGTHDTLMRDCEVYRDIARSQLREEEL